MLKKQQTYVAPGLGKNGELEKRCRYYYIPFRNGAYNTQELATEKGRQRTCGSITNAYIILGNYKVITI